MMYCVRNVSQYDQIDCICDLELTIGSSEINRADILAVVSAPTEAAVAVHDGTPLTYQVIYVLSRSLELPQYS